MKLCYKLNISYLKVMLKEKENNKFVEKVVHFLPMANFGASEKSAPELLYKLGIFRHLPYHMIS